MYEIISSTVSADDQPLIGARNPAGTVSALEGFIHWGRVAQICVSKLTIIGSDNGLRLVDTKLLSEPMLEYC